MSHARKSKASKVEAKRFFAGMSAFVQVFTGLSSSSGTQFGYNNTTQITECVTKGDFKRSNWLLPVVLCPVVLFTPITVTHNSACERDECSFMSVMAVARLVFPMANTCRSISQSINWSINQSINQSINCIINTKKFPCDSVNINPRLWILCKRRAPAGNIRNRHPIR